VSVIAHFTVPAEDFIFADLLGSQPTIRLRLETMVPTGSTFVPYCWIREGDVEAVQAAFDDSPVVASARLLDQVEDQTLFRIEWSEELNGFFDAIYDAEAVLLEGSASGDEWTFRLRFPDYEALSTFYRACIRNEIGPVLEKMHNPIEPQDAVDYGLTARQREALLAALEAGYFDIPRQTTLVELSERLGVSDAATSQRLRRGIDTLVSATLALDSDDRFGDSR
jgi:predicted DNA binding protein